ncbi:cell division protein FtsI [Thiohalobacter thiocyanaticus]|uniref:Cell division protein FtsI n=1 Tax=Thiohalobacter thiocyanaticus TaxID=585455 RepID=A0A1Z4VVB6_9GAMM|nr:cell division protein FtsI [Thiohalobacter thiocyanaticus]
MTWAISSESAAGAAGEMNPEAAVIAAASVFLNIDFSQRTPVRVRMIIVSAWQGKGVAWERWMPRGHHPPQCHLGYLGPVSGLASRKYASLTCRLPTRTQWHCDRS